MPAPNTKIIPGHGPTVTRAAVATHRDMILTVRDRDREADGRGQERRRGRRGEGARGFRRQVDQVGTTGDRFVRQVYAELKATR